MRNIPHIVYKIAIWRRIYKNVIIKGKHDILEESEKV